MPDSASIDQEFLRQLTATVEKNIANEQFGVSELADALSMSRSNLLRKVKKATNLSVSQVISQVRLKCGMELLRAGTFNVSEVSVQVGFSSTSYFIKCFREYYGYPPGEVGKRANEPEPVPVAPPPTNGNQKSILIAAVGLVLVLAMGWFIYSRWPSNASVATEKSIAVLPFKNDSNDSSNLYLINGLMESTLNNLQKIKDLKVISRTSAEKYRNNARTIPEMAKELNVSYFVEGSGQKMGDRIVLNIQLIDASDRHLWSRQYRREVKDIFALQQEISKDIAEEIQATITPEEKTRIEKIPTNNMMAYDTFLKGIDLMDKGGDSNLQKGIAHFDDAIKEDNTFALAYAYAGIACYYLDVFHAEKKYLDKLDGYADKALLYDPKSEESLTAKAMYHYLKREYGQALPYLEKGLEYNPNSTRIIGLLADFYAVYLPNTGKYLEYALKGLRLGTNSGDSTSVSYMYLRLGNALIQTGFVDESLKYIDKSLEYNPNNPYSRYVRAFVLYAKNRNLGQTKELLLTEFKKDTNRFDILQDIGKVSFYLKEYDTAYQYYKRFNRFRKAQNLDVYQHENMTIGLAYEKVGRMEESKELIKSYKQYLDTDQTAYKNLGLAFYFSHAGDNLKSIEHLQLFAKEDNIQYWIILFLKDEPMLTNNKYAPECEKAMTEIVAKFWKTHQQLKESLEEKGLM